MHVTILGLLTLVGQALGQDLRALRHRRQLSSGYNSIAVVQNSTIPSSTPASTTAPSLTSTKSSPQRPVAQPSTNGTITSPLNGTSPSNETCGGSPTLNVLSASLDWWYTQTLYYAVSTFSIQFNVNDTSTGWTLLPASTPFDVISALATPSCTSSLVYDASASSSLYDVECFAPATPVAADTTIITQTAFIPPTATTGTGPLPDLISTPPPASITIPDFTSTIFQGTPFVYFSTYEIITKSPTTDANGKVGCASATSTFPMSAPFGFEYAGPPVNGTKEVGAGVTGDVAPAFLGIVGQSKAVAGSWVAAPTVALVMQEVMAAEAVLAESTELTPGVHASLEAPTPTLPSGFSPVGPEKTGHTLSPIGFTGRVESTQTFLQIPSPSPTQKTPQQTGGGNTGGGNDPGPTPAAVSPAGNDKTTIVAPFVGQDGTSKVTLAVAVNPTQTVITATFAGGIATVTRVSPEAGGTLTQAAGGAPGTPSNALQVLTQAAQSLEQGNPTVSAILHGIGGGNVHQSGGAQRNGPVIVVGGTTFTGNAQTQFNVGPSATLTPGGTAVVGGTTLSLLPGGKSVVVDGQTEPVASPTVTEPPALTIGSRVIQPNTGSSYIIDGQTLSPGGQITVDGTTISLAKGPSSIVVNGLTQKLGPGPMVNPATMTAAPALTIGGEKFTAVSGHTYVVGGETLTPGDKETVALHGTTYVISLVPGGTVLIIETEGPNGKVTETTYETLIPGKPARSTVTNVVGGVTKSRATAGSTGSSGPKETKNPNPNLQNGASTLSRHASSTAFVLATFVLAMWL